MSTELYNTWWIKSLDLLGNLKEYDAKVQKVGITVSERPLANFLVGDLYARYTLAVESLATCLDQACTVQKRVYMRKIVDSAVIRLNELKEDLNKINLSEYHYIDGNLIELKLIPHSIEILSPGLVFNREQFIEDLWTNIKKGERIYTAPPPPEPITFEEGYDEDEEEEEENVEEEEEETTTRKRKHVKPAASPQVPVFKPPVIVLTPEEIEALRLKELLDAAVLIIQSHERSRQDRLYHGDLEIRHIIKQKAASKTLLPDAPIEDQEAAVLNMQKIYRGHTVRSHLYKREVQRRLLIGMTESGHKSYEEKEKFQSNLEKRRQLQQQRIREYVDENLSEKARVLRVISPGLMEDVGDEIRQWFHQWYVEAKSFDKYPTPEKGGSILIVRGETMTPKEWIDEVEKRRKEKNKGKDAKAKKEAEKKKKLEAKKAEDAKKKKEKEKLKKLAEEQKKKEAKGLFDYKMEESPMNQFYTEALEEYDTIWTERPFSENKEERHYKDIITDEKCLEMQLEIRPFVDDLMRLELEVLMAALAKDKGKKYKAKKPKKSKKKRGKKNKDMTANRTTEDLFQELVDNGIIRTYPKRTLEEFRGDFSYKNMELRDLEFDPPATLGDVRRAVALNCILPLGVGSMKKPKSVLIAGHRQSGKHILANAIFNETRCVLFDISPPILAGKYEGKKNMKLLVHLINKMSRLLQPSIIFIDGGEKPFYKSVPKAEKIFEPKKMKKALPKQIIKPLMPQDRVLVLAISNQPFAGGAKLAKTFEKVQVILIPRTDYGSLYLYWRELLMPFYGVDRDFNCSELALVSQNYPLAAVREAVERVMVPGRVIQLSFKPLDAHELLTAMLEGMLPVEDKEWKKMIKWFNKSALAKKRAKLMKIVAKKREAAKPKAKK